jgi:acyl-coenzyme A thioesterase PaaI-like protein
MTTTSLERLRASIGGTARLAPVTGAFGTRLLEVERGRVVARIPALPPSVLQGVGAAFVVGDLALSASISSQVDTAHQVTTLTMHASAFGPLPPAGSPLEAVGRVVSSDRDSAVSTAEIRDADGRLVVVLTGRSAVFPAAADWGRWTSDPEQPVEGFAALQATTTRDSDGSTASAAASALLANSGGAVQGGVLAAVAAHAVDDVIAAARPRLDGAPSEVDITFLRGVIADGDRFEARAEIVHGGSRFASARAELRTPSGRLALVATGSRFRGSD